MDKISKFNVVHRYERRALLVAINCEGSLAIFFFGYDQGMMGSVNVSIDYAVNVMKFGHVAPNSTQVVVDNTLLQGGITSVYYLGCLVGCLVGGWIAEKVGRIKVIALGSIWGVFGASLQCSAQNSNWMICARLINGIGTGMLNVIVPVWSTETAPHTSRGMFVSVEFFLNIFGVVVAYWLGFGCSYVGGGYSSFVWRFPVAFQIIPLLFLFAIVWFFPESPRWLVKVGREDEARYILGRLRGETGNDDLAEAEFQDIRNVAELEKKSGKLNSYFHMLWDVMPKAIGGGSSGVLHIGRRVQLVVWLQILQEWIGIAGVTIYANDIFNQAGYSGQKARWISGVNDITYMFSTLIAIFTLDRLGRRVSLYWGAIVMGVSMFLAGGLSRGAENNPEKAGQYGAAAAAFTFIFTAGFGATWLTIPWLYPAEIFPLQIRAKGNAWGVVGWSIGNGWTVLLLPTMFAHIHEKVLYIFGAVNFLTIPIVWALYPESNQRTLEEMDLLFASNSWWNWDAETNFARLREENPELVQAAQRGGSVVDPETGVRRKSVRGPSLVAGQRDESPTDLDEKPDVQMKN
ncbi:hypothetical protein ABVK25_008797 [Lepraria finkii]|uniref:Major facilitator superfamily (MFS) profile domain-containing protein n=1 Tax=Lepraria finkii TaxID=1340010 RepID=A0ABR4B1Y1_9LECA